jgi:hypothetical protein
MTLFVCLAIGAAVPLCLGSERIAWFQSRKMPHIDLTSALILTARATFPLFNGMGNAISPRGDMLKNRVQHDCKDAACLQCKPFPPKNERA